MDAVVEGPVTVHRLSLGDDAGDGRRWLEVLSPGERRRAARFRFAKDRARFVAARAGLRRVLAGYAHAEARDLRFGYGPYGKPWLRSRPEIRFNLSHAREVALVAVAFEREVGIDVEWLDGERDLEAVAQRFCSPGENWALQRLPEAQRPEALRRLWCRKEAYLKARGTGLTVPLCSFDVAVDPRARRDRSLLLGTSGRADDVRRWCLLDLEVGAAVVAALAWEVFPLGYG